MFLFCSNRRIIDVSMMMMMMMMMSLKCGGICNDPVVANFVLSLAVKEFLKIG